MNNIKTDTLIEYPIRILSLAKERNEAVDWE